MGISIQDRIKLKSHLIKLAQVDPDTIKQIFDEVTAEAIQEKTPAQRAVDPRTEALIQEIFDEFEDTFRALA